MVQCIVIDVVPAFANKGADQKEQCALRLMEIRYQPLHNLVVISWSNNNLSTGMKDVKLMTVEIAGKGQQGVGNGRPLI